MGCSCPSESHFKILVKTVDKFEIVECAGDGGAVTWGRGGSGGIGGENRAVDGEAVGVDPCGVGCAGGVDGKSGPRRRLKVNGVCTAGRCKNLEDGEPI